MSTCRQNRIKKHYNKTKNYKSKVMFDVKLKEIKKTRELQ